MRHIKEPIMTCVAARATIAILPTSVDVQMAVVEIRGDLRPVLLCFLYQ